jgi:intracellular septation protein
MKLLYDFFPLLLFFAAFKLYDIYIATAAAIVATFVQVGWHWIRTHRFETMHLTTLGVLVIFGGMTLLLRDDTFIRWKPTIVYVILAAIVFASQFIGNKTVLEKMLGTQVTLPQFIWNRLNLSWGIFFLFLGALNLYVAFYYGLDQDTETRLNFWVNFKVFGLLGFTVLFVLVQAIVMAKYMADESKEGES